MHYASFENISKSYGVRTLFKNISFHISEGDKIALIARNGYGKSTLLKIIAGKETTDSGTVWIHKDIKVLLLLQEANFNKEKSVWDTLLSMDNDIAKTVLAYEKYVESGIEDVDKLSDLLGKMDELDAWNFESEFKQILGKLNIHHLDEKIGNLSGGQIKRVALAQVLLEAQLAGTKSLMILDEPTNHLDVEMIEWLETYLSASRNTLLLVSHDRYFLDAVCNNMLEIDEQEVFKYTGDYFNYIEQKAHRIEVAQSELKKDKNIFRKELEWMRKQPKARTTKSKSRQDNFAIIEDKVSNKKEVLDVKLDLKMTRLGGKILELKKIYKSYPNLEILKGFDYTFKKGERIGIVGKNGVGKSTFIKIAMGLQEPDSGKVNHGETVIFGHFSQEGLQWEKDMRVIEFLKEKAEFFPLSDGSKLSASAFLERFAFTAEQQYTFLSKLSGGEKRRLQLLSILFLNPNFLVLDEPTNDLDLQTLQLLEDFLQNYAGCLMIVSHDRYFMDKIVDHLFVFEGNAEIRIYPGNYTQYRIEEKEKVSLTRDKGKKEIAALQEKIKDKKQLSFNDKKEKEK
nr:ABC-F family ATP-binding cassette domain-containing protein [Chitinophagaceae bacterium]